MALIYYGYIAIVKCGIKAAVITGPVQILFSFFIFVFSYIFQYCWPVCVSVCNTVLKRDYFVLFCFLPSFYFHLFSTPFFFCARFST